jgi:endonuclease/exonuclease/phosphatase family metal-dependent hydrolase
VLRVATYNVRRGRPFEGRDSWWRRRRSLLAHVRALDADVLALQEPFWAQLRAIHRGLGTDGHQCVGVGRVDGRRKGELCPVLVRRTAADVVASTTRWYADAPDVPGSRLPAASHPRVATVVRLRLRASATEITVVDTHLDEHRADNRRRSLELLLGWLDPALPTIVLGDLNAPPDDPALGVLTAAGFRSVLDAAAPGTAHDFTGRTDGPRIDHVFVDARWTVAAARVDVLTDRRPPSDHWPVVADLELAEPTG